MKNLLYFVLVIVLFTSCKKEAARPQAENKDYLGTYLSTSYDTAYVSENNPYLRIKICRYRIPSGYHFKADSVVLNTETLTFQDNEVVDWLGMGKYKSIGRGSFVGNKLSLSFTFQGSILVNFDGYKQ